MTAIHPSAIIDPRAKLGINVVIGAYTIVDGDVEIGEGTTVGHHSVITGHTSIGRDNRIYHSVSVGEANQDKKYKGEPTRLVIGDRNTIREFCSLNRGTVQDHGVTTLPTIVLSAVIRRLQTAHSSRVTFRSETGRPLAGSPACISL
jgi:UDP-N-acetylglucosamine acyltransferase